MKLKSIMLMLLSVGLVALTLAACGEEKGPGNETPSQSETVTYELSGDTISGDNYYETRDPDEATEPNQGETDEESHADTVAPPVITEQEATEEVIGPQQPPSPKTEPEETLPPFDGGETNEDGEIELPFVPF